MLAWKVALTNTGASMGAAGFNAVKFFPDQPDEMGLWSKGVYTRSCRWWVMTV